MLQEQTRHGISPWLGSRHLVATLYRSITNPRRLLQEIAIWRDFRRFQHAGRGVLEMASGAVTKGDVLLVSLSGSIYGTKIEGMLAKALEFDGYKPIVLTRRTAYWVQKYFTVFGINEFVFLDDYVLTHEEQETCRRVCDELMRAPLDLPTIKTWHFEGADVGQFAISTTARLLHRGMPDLSDQRVVAVLREQLFRSLCGVFIAKRIFGRLNPQICIFNEVNYSDYGPVYAMALRTGLNIVQYVIGHQDNALIFKRLAPETHRIHPNSISRSEMDRISGYAWSPGHDLMLQEELRSRYSGVSFAGRRDQKGKQLKDRGAIYDQLGLRRDRKTVVVFSHVLWDANLFYGDDLFDDNEHWFIETVRAAAQNDHVNWIVRLHPAITWKRAWDNDRRELNELCAIREQIGDLPEHVKLQLPENDINSLSIFEIADYGVTIRGTVGIELPCLGVPVLTAGTGRYSGLGFTVDSQTREEYLSRLSHIHEIPPLTEQQRILAKKHALAIFCLRPWVMRSFDTVFDESWAGFHPLNPNLVVRIDSYKSLRAAEDLRKFVQWCQDTSRFDYMEMWPMPGDDVVGASSRNVMTTMNLPSADVPA